MKRISRHIELLGGFKCDAPGCDYKEERESFEYVEEFLQDLKDHLSMNCPKCGTPLLTPADYKNVELLIKVLHNPIIQLIDKIAVFCGAKRKKYHVDMNGTGEMKIEEMEVTNE
jgi:hypothetical protein